MNEKIIVIGQVPPPFHGSNVMAQVMLSALSQKGYRVIFVDKLLSKTHEAIGQLSVYKIFRIPVLALQIVLSCLSKRPDLCIYFPAVGKSAFLLDAFLLWLIRLCRVPYILRFGGKGYQKLQNENRFWKWMVSSALSGALGGIVLGEGMKWDVNACIPHHRLVTVPNGIARPNARFPREKAPYVQVLYLANLIPTKGPLEVLKAARIVLQANPDVRFVLAGGTSFAAFTERLRAYIDQNGLKSHVSLAGSVKGAEKEKLYASSDIFVFPTYFKYEVFGTVNIEAMSFGLPVVTSSEGVIAEIVQDGQTGFIVDPQSPREIAEKLLLLINDGALRAEMGKRAQKVFEGRYTLEAHANYLHDAVSYLLSQLAAERQRQLLYQL